MTDYPARSLKYDPVTGNIAVRTHFSEETFPNMAWLVATPNRGAHPMRSDAEEFGSYLDNFEVVDGQIVLPEGP